MHPVLSKEDHKFWDENGYVIIHEAVPPENIKAATDAIWDFLEMQPDNRESWYPNPPRQGIGVEMYHHQAFWDNRQYPRVYEAFVDIWGTEKLWVSFDRGSMSPPDRSHPQDFEKLNGGPSGKQPLPMHFDGPVDPTNPFCVQGVLYLTDTKENGGAFICVPGFHRKVAAWLETVPPDSHPNRQDFMSLSAKPIAGKAGDLIIWHQLLPHGASQNTARDPRVVQYLTMFPAQEKDEDTRNYRVSAWQDNLAGGGAWGVMHELPIGKKVELRKEREHAIGRPAELSPLGRKLLGLDSWEDESKVEGADSV